MKEKLIEIEGQIRDCSTYTNLTKGDLCLFPENLRQIHSFKIFGNDLLAIPANLIAEDNNNEFEIPFNFLDSKETLNIFESEFRQEISSEFIQIGNLYGSAEIVLLNKLTNNVHIFHVSDIADKDWLNYKLEKDICNFETFIYNIRPQTVCCLINPKDYSKYDIFEIRNNIEIKRENKILKCDNTEEAWKKYKELVENSLEKGYKIHYAPKKLINEIGK